MSDKLPYGAETLVIPFTIVPSSRPRPEPTPLEPTPLEPTPPEPPPEPARRA